MKGKLKGEIVLTIRYNRNSPIFSATRHTRLKKKVLRKYDAIKSKTTYSQHLYQQLMDESDSDDSIPELTIDSKLSHKDRRRITNKRAARRSRLRLKKYKFILERECDKIPFLEQQNAKLERKIAFLKQRLKSIL